MGFNLFDNNHGKPGFKEQGFAGGFDLPTTSAEAETTPLTIFGASSIEFWGEMDDVNTTGTDITRLNDKSGNGNNWPVNGVAYAKLVSSDPDFNNQPTAHHNGLAMPGVYNTHDMSSNSELEAFVLLKLPSDPPGDFRNAGLWRLGTAADDSYHPFTDGVIYDLFASTVRKTTGNPTPSLASPHLYNPFSTSGEWSSRINGTGHFSTGTNTVGIRTAAAGARVGHNGVNSFISGSVAMWLIINREATSDERDSVIEYVNGKFGTSF